jgi:excisionase family DNA binding protein
MSTSNEAEKKHESDTLPRILKVEELADLLRIDRKTAYAAIAEGGVPGVRRVGRTIRISRDAVLAWLDGGQASRGKSP